MNCSYRVYDMNGDGSLAREELYHCLRGCIYPGYGIEADEIDDAERGMRSVVIVYNMNYKLVSLIAAYCLQILLKLS